MTDPLFKELAQYMLDHQYTLSNGAGPEDTQWSICRECLAPDFSEEHKENCSIGELAKRVKAVL